MKRVGLHLVACIIFCVGLSSCVRDTSALKPVAGFALAPYLGTWYEIARLDHRFEKGLQKVTAQYSLNADNTVKVLNRGFNVKSGQWKEAQGKARMAGAFDTGLLKVSFFGPFYADYKIIHLDPAYQWAVVTSSSMKYLWILSRTPQLPEAMLSGILAQVKQDGFDASKLIWVDQPEAPEYPGYALAWHDEFNQDGRPDPNHWTYEQGFVRNNELQWYQPDNARCENGMLIIEARREDKPNPNFQADSRNWKQSRAQAEYTSASLRTRGLHEWTYGRFEMRARLKTQSGLWPAFWTLGSQRPWPGCGEIDIMEYYRGDILANACWASERRWNAVWDSSHKKIADFNDAAWDSKFHLWRMDWDDQAICLYMDDVLLNTIELDKTINKTPDQANPFKEPHYLIVNLAIGGTNGGDPADTPFPSLYEIDYVRVYQKE